MKATVTKAQMGLAAGDVVEVVSQGAHTAIVKNGSMEVTVCKADLVFDQEPLPAVEPDPEPEQTTEVESVPEPVKKAKKKKAKKAED